MSYSQILELGDGLEEPDGEIIEAVEVAIKYEGYICRQEQQVTRFKKLEDRRIPEGFNYNQIKGFSTEVVEKAYTRASIFHRSSFEDFRSDPCGYFSSPRRT